MKRARTLVRAPPLIAAIARTDGSRAYRLVRSDERDRPRNAVSGDLVIVLNRAEELRDRE